VPKRLYGISAAGKSTQENGKRSIIHKVGWEDPPSGVEKLPLGTSLLMLVVELKKVSFLKFFWRIKKKREKLGA